MAHPGMRPHRPFRWLVLFSVLASSVLGSGSARAERAVEGRLSLLASYGLLVHFYQHEDASPYDPRFGHGLSFRFGGERCGAVCLGLSVLGSVPMSPAGTGSVSVGPHLAHELGGPSWGGPLTVRFGVVYGWYHVEEAVFASDGQVSYADPRGEHGVGAWLELALELLRRPSAAAPTIGLAAGYQAVVTTDPVAHVLEARLVLGLSVGRRLAFDEGEADEEPAVRDEDLDVEEDPEDLSADEERRLRQAEETLRRW